MGVPTTAEGGGRAMALSAAALLAAGALLLWPALATGAPLAFFGDTAGYFQRIYLLRGLLLGVEAPESGQLVLGRSLAYSLVLWASQAVWPVWGTPALQAGLIAGTLVWLGARLAPPGAGLRLGPALILAAAVSSAPFFASLLMPDIFTALMIVWAAALVAFWGRLARWEVAALALGVLGAATMHDSNLPLLIGLTAAAFVPGLAGPGRRGRLRGLMAGLCLGAAAAAALQAPALARLSGEAPARLPFVAVHLIEMGPGRALLAERCPEIGLALCDFEIAADADWNEMLFSREPGRGIVFTVDEATRLRLGREQARFALAVLAARPAETATGLARDGLRQLGRFSLSSLGVGNPRWEHHAAGAPEALRRLWLGDYAPRRDPRAAARLLAAASLWIQGVTVAALGLGAWAAVRLAPRARAGDAEARRALTLAGLLVFGVVLNGLVCGVLASPYDRFQARVIWLVPVAAAILLAQVRVPATRAAPQAAFGDVPARAAAPAHDSAANSN